MKPEVQTAYRPTSSTELPANAISDISLKGFLTTYKLQAKR